MFFICYLTETLLVSGQYYGSWSSEWQNVDFVTSKWICRRYNYIITPDLKKFDDKILWKTYYCKRFLNKKPIWLGFKSWCLNTRQGFLVGFQIYQGLDQGRNEVYGSAFGKLCSFSHSNYLLTLERALKSCMCNCLCNVIVLCGMRMKGRRWNPVPAHGLLFSKSTKGVARLNVPIRRTNRNQQYCMYSQHVYCRRVWNLTQTCDVQTSV